MTTCVNLAQKYFYTGFTAFQKAMEAQKNNDRQKAMNHFKDAIKNINLAMRQPQQHSTNLEVCRKILNYSQYMMNQASQNLRESSFLHLNQAKPNLSMPNILNTSEHFELHHKPETIRPNNFTQTAPLFSNDLIVNYRVSDENHSRKFLHLGNDEVVPQYMMGKAMIFFNNGNKAFSAYFAETDRKKKTELLQKVIKLFSFALNETENPLPGDKRKEAEAILNMAREEECMYPIGFYS
ncbi:hypothetical protein TRFO_36695 [Tritrichomonas foetus]|uniref:Uncharacterized protein n=1 Tax=Tritrichomonas foetus TaxID=1144522 RepID=A0A1J4JD89_9EUKA|nr:hypothetical protein TRFO_36695 [Tritrichomonas foetus]|eukprot:OHS97166.1 hypothetical protein TRFO_36695 [Tritrichomonas foetus]